MLLNTFSGYDMEIADLSQLGANAERARTTSCLTSRSPGPAKPKDARCQESRMLGRFEAAVRGGADNFTTSETSENVTKVIAVQAKGMLWEGCWVPWKTLGRLGKAAAGSGSTPTSQEHLVLLLKFRYLVLVIYAMFSISQSCLVFGRGM